MSDEEVWTLERVRDKMEWEGGWDGLYGYMGYLNSEDDKLNHLFEVYADAYSALELYWESLDVR